MRDYNPLNIYPQVDATGSMYDALFEKFHGDTASTFAGNVNNIPATSANRVFVVGGSGTLSIQASGVNFPNNKDPAVVFVPGNMIINGNVEIGDDTGIIFIIKGYVDVKPEVEETDGIYIFDEDYTVRSTGNPVNEEQLVVNGSVIGGFTGGEFDLGRDFRSARNKTTPTELFDFEPKYLWLFRDIIGDTKTVWKEVAP